MQSSSSPSGGSDSTKSALDAWGRLCRELDSHKGMHKREEWIQMMNWLQPVGQGSARLGSEWRTIEQWSRRVAQFSFRVG